jgi:hypothetical protein
MCSGWEESGLWRPVHPESLLQCGPFNRSACSQKAVQDQQKDVTRESERLIGGRTAVWHVLMTFCERAAHSKPR